MKFLFSCLFIGSLYGYHSQHYLFLLVVHYRHYRSKQFICSKNCMMYNAPPIFLSRSSCWSLWWLVVVLSIQGFLIAASALFPPSGCGGRRWHTCKTLDLLILIWYFISLYSYYAHERAIAIQFYYFLWYLQAGEDARAWAILPQSIPTTRPLTTAYGRMERWSAGLGPCPNDKSAGRIRCSIPQNAKTYSGQKMNFRSLNSLCC